MSSTMCGMSTPLRHDRRTRVRTRLTAGLLVAAALVSACAGGDDDDSAGDTVPTPSVGSTGATTGEDTAVVDVTTTTTEAPTTTPAPTEAPTTIATTTTTTLPPTTTTSEPLSVQELVLRTDGLGSARFGADPEGVIAYVTSILGGNTADTGWVDPFTFAACNGTVARKVDWGVLSLHFTDLSGYGSDRRHFVGYEYGLVGQIGDEPVGLRTPGGITRGSRVVDLLAEFPDASVNAAPDENFPDNFYVSDVFWGLLTGVEQDDLVTVFFGGEPCGG